MRFCGRLTRWGDPPSPQFVTLYAIYKQRAALYYYKVGGFISQNIKGDTHYNNAKYNINTSQTQNNIKHFIKIIVIHIFYYQRFFLILLQ